MNQLLQFLFLDTVVRRRGGEILLHADRAKTWSLGLVLVLFGAVGLLAPGHGFGLPALFSLYGLLHFLAAARYRVLFDARRRLVTIAGLTGQVRVPFCRVRHLVLERVRQSFFLHLTHDGGRALVACFRTSRAEPLAYLLVDDLEAMGLTVRDETTARTCRPDLSPKVKRLAPGKLLVRTSFWEMPKDFLLFSAVFAVFGAFGLFILPPEAPWPVRVLFPGAAFLLALLALFLGGRDLWLSWLLEGEGDRFTITWLFFHRLPVRRESVSRAEIIRLLPRPYVYRQSRNLDFEKGLTLHLVTPRKSLRLGALLSSEDVETLKHFFGGRSSP